MPTWWEHLIHVVSGRAHGHDDLPDLRGLTSRTVAVERTPYVVNDRERHSQEDRLYVLRHRAATRGERARIAVFSHGRGVGFLPRPMAAAVAPSLRAIGGAAVVNGTGARQGSLRLRVEVPTVDAFEEFAQSVHPRDRSRTSRAGA
ncbi:MAG: hypothetical protein EOO67_10235 [Microbacterium sp.]|nr:MAG: hypothetical protein EOO67_10235 [Microbacterium sp.]